MMLNDTILLAADTMRSRAYVQAMQHRGIRVAAAIIVRSPGTRRYGQSEDLAPGSANFGPLFVPDLTIPLERSVAQITSRIETSEAGSINAGDVTQRLKALDAGLVVFSGFGGELVKPQVLACAEHFLHIHAGWLPDYRGSTTIYYSYLREQRCGASAIFLENSIDTGPIVARKKYPPPPRDADVDYYYDSVIRSDLLVTVLEEYHDTGGFPHLEPQDRSAGSTYYIIHPVLKHIALLRIHGAGHSPE